MNILKFKTTIHCGGCIATVTPALKMIQAIDSWEVDTSSADKILTVRTNVPVSADIIISSLKEKGFQAESITL